MFWLLIFFTYSSILAWKIWWTEEPGGSLHTVNRITNSQTWLSDTFTFICYFQILKIIVSDLGMCAQSCSTLCDPMDYSLPGSSVAISYSRGSPLHRDGTYISCLLHWQADSLPLAPPKFQVKYLLLKHFQMYLRFNF